MELYVGAIGAIAAVFVVIFGGRGLIDLVRGYSERRRARLAATSDPRSAAQPAKATAATAVAEPREAAAPTPAVPLVEPDPVYRRTFVGRDVELKQLHDAFDEALAGHGSLAMVVGEPGIGKTSLCEQLAGYVAEKGGKTLIGHCYEEGSLSLPYLAFVEAVRSHVLVLEPDDLKSQLAQGADELARIVPEIRERMQIESSQPGDPEEERYRLLQGASDFLRNAAAAQPLLVILEDLHDADRGTLDMLTHLARNLSGSRLLVVGTYRDVQVDRAHPLASALAELRRVTTFERILLRGLSQDDVHRMLESIAGHEVPWRWGEVVHRQTEGSPLFIQEVMRYLVEEGLLSREEGELRRVGDEPLAGKIPEGLRDVIGKRMTRLSEQANRVLSLASVIGREFRLDVLQAASDTTEEVLYAVLEEAGAAAVLEERPAVGVVSYRFAHAFFRQTLYEEMIAPRRIRLHQQVAGILEKVHAGRLAEHAGELADHFGQSTDTDDLVKAVYYGEMASQRAMEVFAYGEAERQLGQALQVQEVLDPADKAKRCDLLLALGEAILPAEDPRRAAETVAPEALSLAEALGDESRAARSSLQALEALQRAGRGGTTYRSSEFGGWADKADHHAEEGTVERVWADIYLALHALFTSGPTDAHRLLRRATDRARSVGEPRAFFAAAAWDFRHLTAPRDRELLYQLADEIWRRDRSGINARVLGGCLIGAAVVFLELGDRDRAEEAWRQLKEIAGRSRDATLVMDSVIADVLPALLDGNLEEAVAVHERAVAAGQEVGLVGGTVFGFGGRLAARAMLHLGRGLDLLPRSEGATTRPNLAIRALILAHLSRHEEAQAIREQFGDVGSDDDSSATVILLDLLEAAVLRGDKDTAGAIAPRLSFLAPRPVVLNDAVSFGRPLGDAAVLLGKPDEARAYYQQALEACAQIRSRPEIALLKLQLAELLLDHYPDERDEAIEHLDFAIAEFRDMKMQPSLEKAEALIAAQIS